VPAKSCCSSGGCSKRNAASKSAGCCAKGACACKSSRAKAAASQAQSEPNLCIVKFGGSAITDKRSAETLKPDELKQCVAALARCWASGRGASQSSQAQSQPQSQPQRFIVLHGAGSFGHPQAKKHGIAQGYDANSSADSDSSAELSARRVGFSETRLSVTSLHLAVVRALVNAGLPAVGVSPCSLIRSRALATSPQDFAPLLAHVRSLLDRGFLPVLHGDAVLDDGKQWSILRFARSFRWILSSIPQWRSADG